MEMCIIKNKCEGNISHVALIHTLNEHWTPPAKIKATIFPRQRGGQVIYIHSIIHRTLDAGKMLLETGLVRAVIK